MTILSPTTKTATVRSTFGRSPLTVHYGGDFIDPGEILLDEPRHGRYDGVALRDALLEAFPLEEKVILHETEKKPDFVPGMVVDTAYSDKYVILPEGWYHLDTGLVGKNKFINSRATVAFDPRGAKALPSPLGIRVGDRVRKTKNGVTVSFEVGHIGYGTGHIFAKGDSPNLPVAHNPKGFEVVSRKVPGRLPAGTIYRQHGRHYLRVEDGYIDLTDGEHFKGSRALETDLGHGVGEVIYLPES